jgi:MFS family permease
MNNWKKNITLFLISQGISLFGSMLVQYAIMWYIVLQTESGIMMTIYIAAGLLPTFFLSPFGGVWADRFDRKLLIILADSGIAAATLILAILFLTGYKEIWLLFAAAGIRAAGTGIHVPAVGAFIPQIVPGEKLTRVNGIAGSIQSIIMLISPMVSAALLTFASIELIFFIDVVTATPAEVGVSSQAGWHCAQLLGSASCGTCSGTCCACKYIAALTPCFCSCAGHSPWCVLCVHVLICSTLSLHHQYSALQSLSQTPGDL